MASHACPHGGPNNVKEDHCLFCLRAKVKSLETEIAELREEARVEREAKEEVFTPTGLYTAKGHWATDEEVRELLDEGAEDEPSKPIEGDD